MSTTESTIVVCPVCGKKNRVDSSASGIPRCGNCHSPLPWSVSADDNSYAEVVEAAGLPVLVDLWAPWCGPCRMVSPALERIARSHAGKVKLVKINVDESPRVAARHEARSIPTLLILNHGEVMARQIGAAPEHVLSAWLEQTLTRLSATTPG